jgi:hypothetical protein
MQYCSIYCITAIGPRACSKAALAPPAGSMSLLPAFAQYGRTTWPDEFTELLASAGDRTVMVATPPWSPRRRVGRLV